MKRWYYETQFNDIMDNNDPSKIYYKVNHCSEVMHFVNGCIALAKSKTTEDTKFTFEGTPLPAIFDPKHFGNYTTLTMITILRYCYPLKHKIPTYDDAVVICARILNETNSVSVVKNKLKGLCSDSELEGIIQDYHREKIGRRGR